MELFGTRQKIEKIVVPTQEDINLFHCGKMGWNMESDIIDLAEAFIPNPDNLPEVDHIDKKRGNNALGNLRWASRSSNGLNRDCKGYRTYQIAGYDMFKLR